ncbi:MAG TPA: PadR family transcriptional regulator [Candidatus Lokiarchaeia archaeon]|nr:PadR family transcriptional regulator [Candidatus Lokiarchaeia archaeon]
MPKRNKILRKFQRTMNLVLILDWASRGPFYGTEFMDDCTRRGHKMSPGTLYPWLNLLVEEGILAEQDQVVEGKIRKYYTITPAGQDELAEIKNELADFSHSLL